MKKYLDKELVNFVKEILIPGYGSAAQIKRNFILDGKVQSFYGYTLTNKELEEKTDWYAEGIAELINSIPDELILSRISKQILDENYHTGIDINNHKSYFTLLARDLAKLAVSRFHGNQRKKFNEIKKQHKKKR